jgi:transcriptional regulator with XRE-family HTH domain
MKASELVAHNVKRLRVKAGISQERLALDAGIDRTYVSRIERKAENCTVGILEKLAEVIGCKITEFFDEPDGEEIPVLKSGRKPKEDK